MIPAEPPGDATLELAARVAEALEKEGAPSVIIGAMAMAAHHYARATEDLDLAVSVEPVHMRHLAKRLESLGLEIHLREPDPQDPLGGVIDVYGTGADRIQVVNFDNSPAGGFPRLVREALAASSPMEPGSSLRVADLFSLIGFKLYAGGSKSRLDILELLDRNAPVDLAALRAWCKERRLNRELEKVLALAAE